MSDRKELNGLNEIRYLMPKAEETWQTVFIGEGKNRKPAALVCVFYYPVLVDEELIEDAIDKVVIDIAQNIASQLNTVQGKEQ